MKKASEITCLQIDNGLYPEIAVTLARTYKKVYYYCDWQEPFPKPIMAMIGSGLEGVEVVEHWAEKFDEVDLFVVTDIYHGWLQEHLEAMGKKVWGSRLGEDLEIWRDDAKKLMKKVGLPVGPYKMVKGLEALKDTLQKSKKVYVKPVKWRGLAETFCCEKYDLVKPLIDDIEEEAGPCSDDLEFCVEEELPDKIEIGTDAYLVNGKLPGKMLLGYEIKDRAYVGLFRDAYKIPEPILRPLKKMEPYLKDTGYSGFLSTEIRVGADKEPYLIDWTCRAPSPPSALYSEFYTNLADIVWRGANGEMVDPIAADKWGVELRLCSGWADSHWQPIEIPEKNRKYVKIRSALKRNGKYYAVPQDSGLGEMGSVIGWGSTLQAAIDMACEIGDSVKGYKIEMPEHAFDDAEEAIKEGNKIFPGMM